jgi:hypothetical protein
MIKNYRFILVLIVVVVFSGSCASNSSTSQRLAKFTQYEVTVELTLERGLEGDFLIATYSPEDPDAHFYSKDLLPSDIDGIGRPTRIDLAPTSLIQPRGELSESATPEILSVNPDLPALAVYPPGPVTLRLPVTLPAGDGDKVEDYVLISYMACTPRTCYRPVSAKVVEVQIPTISP